MKELTQEEKNNLADFFDLLHEWDEEGEKNNGF